MKKELKFPEIINNIISEINEAKRKATSIHGAGNIKSSGDEVENLIREKISLFLPERYLVKQGHVVNSAGKVSNQFDIIIFDRLSTPKFFESKNDTVFYPIESVLAVGEIKKTLRSNDMVDFGKKIKYLKVDMERNLVENSAFGGIKDKTSFVDLMAMRNNRKYKNPLFSFIFAIDEDGIENLVLNDDNDFMPNDVYVLNWGYFLYGKIENDTIITHTEDEDAPLTSLLQIKKPGIACISTMFNQLIMHLNRCYIDPFSLSAYMSDKDIYAVKNGELKVYNIEVPKPNN